MGYGIWPLLYWRAKDGALVRALASHQCGPGSWCRCHMWVEVVVGSLLFSEKFFSRYSGFPLSSKTNIFTCAISKPYLFIYLFTYLLEKRDWPKYWHGLGSCTVTEAQGVVLSWHTPPPLPGPVHSKHWNLPELISSINISCYHCLINVNSMDSKTLNHNCYIFFIHKKIPHSPSLPFSDTQWL